MLHYDSLLFNNNFFFINYANLKLNNVLISKFRKTHNFKKIFINIINYHVIL